MGFGHHRCHEDHFYDISMKSGHHHYWLYEDPKKMSIRIHDNGLFKNWQDSFFSFASS
jgi:hypothetical protein